jgi:hypothetical protein
MKPSCFFFLFTGVILCGVGSKWQLIGLFGSDVPYMDQWNGEATTAILPWLDGNFDLVQTFWTPHNEHRLGFTRLWALALTSFNGQWDPLFVTTLNALVHVAFSAFLLFLLRSFLIGPGSWLCPLLLAALLSFPLAWENTIAAFQVQVYFAIGSALVVLATLPTNPVKSWKGLVGVLAGLAGIGCLSTSFAPPLVVILLRIIRACQLRKWTSDDLITSSVCAVIITISLLSIAPAPWHDSLHAGTLWQYLGSLIKITAYPYHNESWYIVWFFSIILQGPLAYWIWLKTCERNVKWKKADFFLFGFAAWLALQIAALSYSRGNVAIGSRYSDIIGLLLLANAVSLVAIWVKSTPKNQERLYLFSLLWGLVVGIGLVVESQRHLRDYLSAFPAKWQNYAGHLREFVITDNEQRLRSVPTTSLPFVSHDVMIDVMRNPRMRRVLPPGIRAPVSIQPSIKRGFSNKLPDFLPAPSHGGKIHFSNGVAASIFKSAPVQTNAHLSILRIHFAGHPDLDPSSIRLVSDDGREVPLKISRFRGNGWQSAHLFIPSGASGFRLVAECGPVGQWLAFAEPVEVGFGSWLTHQMRKRGKALAVIGLAILGSGLLLVFLGRNRQRQDDTPHGAEAETIPKTTFTSLFKAFKPVGALRQFFLNCINWWKTPDSSMEYWKLVLKSALVVILTLIGASFVFSQELGTSQLIEHLISFALAGTVLGAPTLLASAWFQSKSWCVPALTLLGGASITATMGWLAFWFWFFDPFVGVAFSSGVFIVSVICIARKTKEVSSVLRDTDITYPFLLMTLIGLAYLGMLHLYEVDGNIDWLAANRWLKLPIDNQIPRLFAEKLAANESPRGMLAALEWLSSDRPPLQTGVILLAWPWFSCPGVDVINGSHAIGMWFQLLWVASAWGIVRSLGIGQGSAILIVGLCATTGFMLINTVYVWPKLGAAALIIGAFAIYFHNENRDYPRIVIVAVMLGLGWIAHGGSAFAMIGMAVLMMFKPPWPKIKSVLIGVSVFAAYALPWFGYQKIYEPPANRLIKWHLAGVIPVDGRSSLQTIQDSYHEIKLEGALKNKIENAKTVFYGSWQKIISFSTDDYKKKQSDEFYYLFRSMSLIIILFIMILVNILYNKIMNRSVNEIRKDLMYLSWVLTSVIIWIIFLFGPGSTVNHSGSLVFQIVLITVSCSAAWIIHRKIFYIVSILQVISMLTTWLPSYTLDSEKINSCSLTLLLSICAICFYCVLRFRKHIIEYNNG